jgi:rhamnulose-1-phosphate aldolase
MIVAFESIVAQLGEVGQRMTALNAAEGAAGNMSVWTRALTDMPEMFAKQKLIDLPEPTPALVGGWLVVSGSGRRLRDIAADPAATLCVLHVESDTTALLYAAPGMRPTSELNSHLLIHNAHVAEHDIAQHAVLHAQPPYLTYLSHALPPDANLFSRRFLRWQPETIMTFPHGVGVLPFETPGSHAQAAATAEAMHIYSAVVWARHGVIVRDEDVRHTADLIEYAEAAAHYEYLNVQAGEPSSGLSDDELRRMCQQLGIKQTMF